MTEINSKSKMSSKKRKKLFFVAVMLSIPVLHWFVFWLYVNLNSILMAFQLPTGEWSLLSLKTVLREISAGDKLGCLVRERRVGLGKRRAELRELFRELRV